MSYEISYREQCIVGCYCNKPTQRCRKKSLSFAASVVYVASFYTGEKRTQADIAKAAGVTEITEKSIQASETT
jgi:transcription initiation factor TFIIIB Brf1 subunit/transcription initiation factor TFIIB